MTTALLRLRRFLSDKTKRATHVAERLAVGPLFALIHSFDRIRASDAMGRLMQRIGPWLPEHKIGRDNLAAAFPEKSAAEIEQILKHQQRISAVLVKPVHLVQGVRRGAAQHALQ